MGCSSSRSFPGAGKGWARLRHRIARAIAFVSCNARSPELGDRFHIRLFWHDFVESEVVSELAGAGLRCIEKLEIQGSTPCTFFLHHE